MPSLLGAGMVVFQYNRIFSKQVFDVGMFISGVFFLCVLQKNNCVLPEDLRDFYLTKDGFMLAWNSKLESKRAETCTDRMKPIIQCR